MTTKFLLDLMLRGSVSVPALLIEHYRRIGLNEQECMLLIELHAFLASGTDFPTFSQLAERMSFDETFCADLLRDLIRRGCLSIVQKNEDHIYSESYSLLPLWEKLLHYAAGNLQTENGKEKSENALYTLFENEFGRPLSPIECETLAMWMDEDRQTPVLIRAALREAVISGKLNFRYIDRILLDWRKNGIRTPEQAKARGEAMRHRQQTAATAENRNDSKPMLKMPAYDWLDKN
ncbi:MAG: DnaD domain-containing protein [Sporolactobacillus sp.]